MDRIKLLLEIQKSLGKIITYYDEEYRKGTPQISDKEFDGFYDLLVSYEKQGEELWNKIKKGVTTNA